MNALVLDDEPRYREHLKHALERQGLQIHVAASAQEAQEVYQGLGVDLMVVDIKLANSIDGLDFADWARKQNGDPALIVITGYGSPENERRSRHLGALAYLEKPFDLEELERHVQRAIGDQQLLREINRVGREVAGGTASDFVGRTAAHMPIACVSASSKVIYASKEVRAILEAVADPEFSRPIVAIDHDLLQKLRDVAPVEAGWGKTTVFRRDGVVAHYQAFVRPITWGQSEGYLVFFQDDGPSSGQAIDELWMGLLVKAARCAGGGNVA